MLKLFICAGIPRSGSTLQYRMVKEILSKVGNVIDLGWLKDQNIKEILDTNDKEKNILLFKTHEYNPFFKSLEETYEITVFSTYRDIRDVFVSLMAFESKDFNNTFSQYRLDKILSDHQKWLGFSNNYCSKYEEIKSNLKAEILKALEFLKIDLNSKEIDKIIKTVEETRPKAESKNQYDPESLLHKNHVNDGSSGQWKSTLSSYQIGIIQYYAKQWLKEHNYDLFPTVYNFPILWKGRKLLEHLLQGTLSKRISDPYDKQQKQLKSFRTKPEGFEYVADSFKMKLYNDSQLSYYIASGQFEQNETSFIENFLKHDDVFIDIGSNIGLFSLIASSQIGNQGMVFAFEPTNKTFSRLLENIELNNLKNVTPFKIAISNKNGTQIMNVDRGGFDAWNSLAKQSTGIFIEQEEIETKSLDSIIAEIELSKIDLIKIDVEGWEVPVFEGARKLFSSPNAPVLMVEFTEENASNAGYTCKDLYVKGLEYGYKWYNYNSGENKLAYSPIQNEYPYQNLIAIKNITAVENRLKK